MGQRGNCCLIWSEEHKDQSGNFQPGTAVSSPEQGAEYSLETMSGLAASIKKVVH